MKKKILFTVLSVILFGSFQLMAQWLTDAGGNTVHLTVATRRVGIGVDPANSKLHVNSAAGENGLRVQINGSTKLLVNSNGGVSVGSLSTPPANGLFDSGNAGIGTTLPDNKLHVLKGSAGVVTGHTNAPLVVENSTHCYINLLAPDASETGILFGKPASNVSGGIIYSNPSLQNGLQFRTNGNVTRMSLTSAGNLGIGVASPTSRLQVAGDLNFDGEGTEIIFDDGQFIRDGVASLDIACHGDFVPDNDGLHNLGTLALTWASVQSLQYLTPIHFDANANIQNLKSGINEIMKLRPISYIDAQGGNIQKFGLIGKEVQQVLPETVRDWQLSGNEAGTFSKVPTSKMAIEYDAFIPLLIKGIQEQQQKIITLEERIAKLEKALNSVSSNNVTSKQIMGASLLQNQPNPFNQNTIIRYTIPAGANAQIMIYDAAGRLVKTLQATESGQSMLNANELKPGSYKYALVANGNVIASKTMVLLK